MPDIRKAITKESERLGIPVEEKPNGHFVIKGSLTVNYYPFSKRRTAYIKSTTKGCNHVDVKKAFLMSMRQPEGINKKDKRKRKSYRKERERLHAKGINNCHWCNDQLTIETSTLEHIIPLDLGGLDNRNNYTLACADCNHGRGNEMKELNQKEEQQCHNNQ